MQLFVNLRGTPRIFHGVLAHFQTAGCHSSGIGSLAGCIQNTGSLQGGNRFQRARHIGAFGNQLDAVGNQCLCVLQKQFVLGGAGQCDFAWNFPDVAAVVIEHCIWGILQILLNPTAAAFLNLLDDLQTDAVRVIDTAVGVGHGDNLRAHLQRFFSGIDCDIARAGDDGHLVLGVVVCHHPQQLLDKVEQAVAGGLCANERTAIGQTLSGQDAGKFSLHPFVLSKEIADFAGTHTDVSGRNIGISADVAGKFGHEALAEAHDFGIGFSFGVKVRAALAAAHRKSGQAVFENLLKGKEFDDGEVDAGMKAQPSLIGADGGIVLDAVAAVDLGVSLVVLPRNPELNHSLRLDQTLHQSGSFILRVFFQNRFEGAENLHHSI